MAAVVGRHFRTCTSPINQERGPLGGDEFPEYKIDDFYAMYTFNLCYFLEDQAHLSAGLRIGMCCPS